MKVLKMIETITANRHALTNYMFSMIELVALSLYNLGA